MTGYGRAPDLRYGNRFVCLAVLPTGFAFGPWVMSYLPAEGEVAPLVVSAFLPSLGLVSVLVYRVVSRDRVLLWPYLPYAFAAVVFAVSMVDLAAEVARDPGAAYIPIVQLGIGLVQPVLALVAGVYCFVRVSDGPFV